MATLATVAYMGNAQRYAGGVGVNDNDIVVQTGDVTQFDEFFLQTTAGAVDVFVTLDGTNYTTAGLSLIDLGATVGDPVLLTVANRMYAFFGCFAKIRVLQNGATAATAVTLMCSPKK